MIVAIPLLQQDFAIQWCLVVKYYPTARLLCFRQNQMWNVECSTGVIQANIGEDTDRSLISSRTTELCSK